MKNCNIVCVTLSISKTSETKPFKRNGIVLEMQDISKMSRHQQQHELEDGKLNPEQQERFVQLCYRSVVQLEACLLY